MFRMQSLRSMCLLFALIVALVLSDIVNSQSSNLPAILDEYKDLSLFGFNGVDVTVLLNEDYPFDKSDSSTFRNMVEGQLRRSGVLLHTSQLNKPDTVMFPELVKLVVSVAVLNLVISGGEGSGNHVWNIDIRAQEYVPRKRILKLAGAEAISLVELPYTRATVWSEGSLGYSRRETLRNKLKEFITEITESFISSLFDQNTVGNTQWVIRRQAANDSLINNAIESK